MRTFIRSIGFGILLSGLFVGSGVASDGFTSFTYDQLSSSESPAGYGAIEWTAPLADDSVESDLDWEAIVDSGDVDTYEDYSDEFYEDHYDHDGEDYSEVDEEYEWSDEDYDDYDDVS